MEVHDGSVGDNMTDSTAREHAKSDEIIEVEGFDSQILSASNDTDYVNEDHGIEELKSRLAAARFEKMMAQQLASELEVDEIEYESSLLERVVAPALTKETHNDGSDFLAETPLVNSRFRRNRTNCKDLISSLQEKADAMAEISDRATSFMEYLTELEGEFANLESLELELEEKNRQIERIDRMHDDQRILIEKQRKQIEKLEVMRQTSTENYEAAKYELQEVQHQKERLNGKLGENAIKIARMERENASLNEKLQIVSSDLEKSNASVNSLRRQSQNQDRQITQTKSELSELTIINDEVLSNLSSLQIKYNELNKRSLEKQGNYYTKIAQFEESTRALKARLEKSEREKSETLKELEAANNLLVLQEEMVSAITPDITH